MSAIQAVALSPEDQARADLYALLARLLYAGPDAGLLATLAGAGEMFEGEQALPQAWRRLCQAAASAVAEDCRIEFDTVFVGVGKAPVTPYLTHYMVPVGHERILVTLRDELAELGLARGTQAVEPEDHIAALMEVMRHLVLRGDSERDWQRQKQFFMSYIGPAYEGFCLSANETPISEFYRSVIELLSAFLRAESLQSEMN